MTTMEPGLINDRWKLVLPDFRVRFHSTRPTWEKERLDSMSKNIGPGDIVYDVGAEEGDFSALYQSWIGKGDGGICLFEPSSAFWANIKAIWDANDLKGPLGFVGGFASSLNRSLDKLDVTTWPESAYGPVMDGNGFCNVFERPDLPSIRLDDFVTLTDALPTVLSIDVEGAELHVLEGARDILDGLKPLVYVSVHPEFMKEMYDQEAQELYDFMADLGYRSKVLAIDHEVHVALWNPRGRELRF